MIQAVTICALFGSAFLWFFFVPQIAYTPWEATVSTFIWLACCGNNCAIYLIFNKTLRQRVLEVLRLKKPSGQNNPTAVGTASVIKVAPMSIMTPISSIVRCIVGSLYDQIADGTALFMYRVMRPVRPVYFYTVVPVYGLCQSFDKLLIQLLFSSRFLCR